MNRRSTTALILLGLTGSIAVLSLAHRQTARLQSEIRGRPISSRNLQELESRKATLLALQVSSDELIQLRRDHEETESLREALTKLGHKSIADELFRRAIADTHSAASLKNHPRAAPETELQNRGADSPKAVLESVIWAASTGNVDALTPLITFQAEGRAKALKVFNALPPAVQAEYGSPEKIYATLLAASLPLGITQASTLSEKTEGDQQVSAAVRVYRRDGGTRHLDFTFRRSGTAWRLIMPDRIVENYGRMLTGS